jgi:4-hydroxy-tetrahydrodipicolinate synthase
MSKNESPVFRGTMPALMTPCDKHGKVDYEALVETGLSLIKEGMSGVIYCGSMGDWPLLTDEERQTGVKKLVDAGVPVVVGTGAPSTASAVAHAEHAKACGAIGLMISPRLLSRGISVPAQREHFSAILRAGEGLQSVIYNSPYYGYQTKADLFFALRDENPNLVGFKEFGGADALSYAAEFITSGDPSLTLAVGVDTQVYHGYVNCGAKCAITGVGNALPKEVLRYGELCQRAAAGDAQARIYAQELEEAMRVLATFDEGPDLVLHYKKLMVLEGHSAYEHQLNSFDKLSPSQDAYLEDQWKLFRSWWANWPGAQD